MNLFYNLQIYEIFPIFYKKNLYLFFAKQHISYYIVNKVLKYKILITFFLFLFYRSHQSADLCTDQQRD